MGIGLPNLSTTWKRESAISHIATTPESKTTSTTVTTPTAMMMVTAPTTMVVTAPPKTGMACPAQVGEYVLLVKRMGAADSKHMFADVSYRKNGLISARMYAMILMYNEDGTPQGSLRFGWCNNSSVEKEHAAWRACSSKIHERGVRTLQVPSRRG